jgi:hypothetical protein
MSPRRRPAPSPASPREQREEVERAGPIGPLSNVTPSMAKGALTWTAIGAVVGGLVGLLLSLIPLGDIAYLTRLWVFVVAGVLAGSTAGFVYGGGRQPELEEDVGNQVAPAPLLETNRDPQAARERVDETRRARDRAEQERRSHRA